MRISPGSISKTYCNPPTVCGICLTPVSYTHLDVYKRQAKPCLIQGLSHQHPALKSSVRPNKPEERSKVISALNTLWIEDPSLSFSINSYSDELEISLYGLTQKAVSYTHLLQTRTTSMPHWTGIPILQSTVSMK